MNTYERLFLSDVRDKKRTGRGAYNRRGKGVKHAIRGIKTPYDFMSTKEKKKLNSEVEAYNMYDIILSKEEFSIHDKEMQKTLLTNWRERYSNRKIMDEMGISNAPYYRLLAELDIPKKPRRVVEPTRDKQPKQKKVGIVQRPKEEKKIELQQVQQAPIRLLVDGLHLEYNGTFDPEQLSKIFTKLQLLVDGEHSNFYLNLSLTEKEKRREEKREIPAELEKDRQAGPDNGHA